MKQGIIGSTFAATLALMLSTVAPLNAATPTDQEFELTSPSGNYLVGIFASKQRDTDTAAKYLGRALSDDPDNRSLVERAFILSLSSGYINRAEALAERVVRHNKRHRMSHIVLGLREARKKRYQSAREHFKKAALYPGW